MGNLYIKKTVIDCLKLEKVIVFKMFVKFTLFFMDYEGT